MAGYNGWSMSNNAVDAYDNGEMPLSKWTKSEILYNLEEYIDNNDCSFSLDIISKLTAREMKDYLLTRSSWHHTSLMFNKTVFYKLDEDYLEELTDESIQNIIDSRIPHAPKTQKVVEPHKFITAFVEYDNWEGTRKHPIKVSYREIVKYMSTDKMVTVAQSLGKKRLSSLYILESIEQKTKFATSEAVMKKYNKRKSQKR